jgi:hypothetical protein
LPRPDRTGLGLTGISVRLTGEFESIRIRGVFTLPRPHLGNRAELCHRPVVGPAGADRETRLSMLLTVVIDVTSAALFRLLLSCMSVGTTK